MEDLVAAIDAVHVRGPRVVLVTSMHIDDTPEACIDLVVSDRIDRYRLRTPQLPITVGGAGDVMAALFLAHHLRSGSAAQAMSLAASSVFGVLNRTAEASSNEMFCPWRRLRIMASAVVNDNPSRWHYCRNIGNIFDLAL
jgi:pyridoxine kinase